MAEKPDPELDELLDSAAKDFQSPSSSDNKPDPGEFDASQFLNPDGTVNSEKWKQWEAEQDKKGDDFLKKAQEDLISSDLFKELEKKMQESLAAVCDEQGISADEISNQLKNLSLFGEGMNSDPDKDKEFSDAIFGAMQSLKDNLSEAFPMQREGEEGEGGDSLNFVGNMENLSSVMQQMMLTLLSKEMLLPSFKEMSEKLESLAGEAEFKTFSTVMRNIMKSLFSKEMMLPSFTDLAQKYPRWLEENKSKLSDVDFKRYSEQFSMVNQIVEELEKPGPEDDQKHLERMVELMQKMQDLGQPPKDLVSQLVNALDDTKLDAIMKDSGANQCNVM